MRTLAMLVLSAFAAAAQSPAPTWSRVASLAPGTEIRIERTGGRPVRGTLLSAADQSLVVNAREGQQMFTRQQVTRVSVKGKSHRGRNTLIGLGVGAGVGLAIGLGARCTGFCLVPTSAIVAGSALGAALIGTVVGAVIPTGGWREIYHQ